MNRECMPKAVSGEILGAASLKRPSCRSGVEAETCLEFNEITGLYVGDPTPPGGWPNTHC
jgi:hypothetical protein